MPLATRRFQACTFAVLITFLTAAGGQTRCSQALWEVDLASTYQFRNFGPVRHPRNHLPPMWTNQQGIEFVSPDVLAVYQVSEVNSLEPPKQRDDSGGSGRYVLHVSFLDVTKGNELKTIRLVTQGSGPSRVFPTHDGRYLIRTGETIRSFSAAFAEIAAARLPNSKTASNQRSDVSVSPSGRLIYIKYNASYSPQFVRGTAILDADSLDPKENLTKNEGPGESQRAFTFVARNPSCPSALTRITSEFSVGYGCQDLRLFSNDGQLLWDIPIHEQVISVRGSGALLVASINRRRANPLDLDFGPEPLRVEIYDIATKSKKCAIPVRIKPAPGLWPSMSYALSASGEVAVIQGSTLTLYKP
jgi:hypothetical protein